MTWPTTVLVDAIFIPVYVILLLCSIFNVTKHGAGKAFGFINICIFSLVRLAGNGLLVYAYEDNYKHQAATTWGFILQALGYSFLLNATLALYKRATALGKNGGNKPLDAERILHLVTLAALILIITGYENSDDVFNANTAATSELDIKAKIGDCIYVGVTVIILLLCLLHLCTKGARRGEARIIIGFILLAIPFMLCRCVYSTIKAFRHNPIQVTLWVKIVFDYVPEVIVVLIFFVMGLCVGRLPDDDRADLEGGKKNKKGGDRRRDSRRGGGNDFPYGQQMRKADGPNDLYVPY